MEKLRVWVHNCDIEISGMGLVENINNVAYVTDVFLVEQICTGSETEMDADALAMLEYRVVKEKLNGTLNFWWHSHVNMGTFWSGTDYDAISQIGTNGYVLSTVFNKKGSMKTSYYQGADGFRPAIWQDDIKTTIGNLAGNDDENALIAEIAKKVKKKEYPVYGRGWQDRHRESMHSDYNFPSTKPVLTGNPPKKTATKDTVMDCPIEFFQSSVIPICDTYDVYEDFISYCQGQKPETLEDLELYYNTVWLEDWTYVDEETTTEPVEV